MSDRNDHFPPDEPVIGDPYAGGIGFASTAATPVIGAAGAEEFDEIGGDADYGFDLDDEDLPEDEYVIGGDDDPGAPIIGGAPAIIGTDDDLLIVDDAHDGNGYGGYADEYEDEEDAYAGSYYDGYADEVSPARQPLFYIFLGVALLVGGIFIFLLFSFFAGGEDAPSLPDTAFNIVIDQPLANERVATGVDLTIAARANASEPITKFELFIQNSAVDSIDAQPPAEGAPYSASFTWRFNSKGEYSIFVRATSESGATKDSDVIKVVAFEGPGDRPVSIAGRVVATVSMRTGPGEDFEAVGTLTAGQQVNIIGKSRNSEWLLIENNGGVWVKRQAIEVLESLALVPVKEPTPVPEPTATNTPDPSPSPTETPTVNPTSPDFVPTNAELADGGKVLRVSIANVSGTGYNGPVVISVSGGAVASKVFNLDIEANGLIVVEFALSPPIVKDTAVQVRVDPDNAIMELNEDNNEASFGLQKPAPAPTDTPEPSPSPSPATETATPPP